MRVSLLTTTPVKSLTVHHPDHLDLSPEGVVGDRAFFLVDEAGELVGCTKDGDLLRYSAAFDPDASVLEVHGPGGLVRSAPVVETGAQVGVSFYGLRTVTSHVIEGWDEVFSEAVGRPTRLVRGESGGFDVHGVTLLGTSTLEALAAANSSDPVDPRRFRLNIQIDGRASRGGHLGRTSPSDRRRRGRGRGPGEALRRNDAQPRDRRVRPQDAADDRRLPRPPGDAGLRRRLLPRGLR